VPLVPERVAPLRIVLSLDLTEEPVSGIVAQARRPNRVFSGWLELIAFLDDAVRAARKSNAIAHERPTT
jgi:hypothetical protein